MTLQSRATGALYGLALGDALGMPTQMLSRPDITSRYGPFLTGFQPAAPDHPLAAGMPAGAVTDDTEQALLLAELLLDGKGRVDPAELARRLVAWEDDMRARGSLDLLGPSTKRAVELVLAGTPSTRWGATAPPMARRCGSPPWASRCRSPTRPSWWTGWWRPAA